MGQTHTAMRGPRGIYPGAPDPNLSSRYHPLITHHARINEAILPPPKQLNPNEARFTPKEAPDMYFRNVYEYLCKTSQEINPELLRVEELLLKLEEQPLSLYKRYPKLSKRRAMEVDFYSFAKATYGVDWDKTSKRKALIQYICKLLQDEFMIRDDKPLVAIESMFTLLPHDVIVRIMEYNKPTQISVGSKVFRINAPPVLDKRIHAIYEQLVLKSAMKDKVINVALSCSFMVTDVSGYYTSLYNRGTGTEEFNPYASKFVGKFTDKDEHYNLKPFDSKEICLFYRSNAQNTSNSIYSYGIRIIPDTPYHIEGEFAIPHKIPLGFKIQKVEILNNTGPDQNGNIVPLIELNPSFFIDDKDPIYPREELDINESEDIKGVDLGFFLGYLTCVMNAIDSRSKIQFRAFLDQDPPDEKFNMIYKEIIRAPRIRTNNEMEKIFLNDPKTMVETLAAPYLTAPFKAVNSFFIDAMIYMGLPIANRMKEKNFSMIWDVSATLKYFVFFPEKFKEYWKVINNIERHRSFAEIQGYNVEEAFLWTFKGFVENSSNTELVKRILKEFFYVGVNDDVVEKAIEEFKRVLSLTIK